MKIVRVVAIRQVQRLLVALLQVHPVGTRGRVCGAGVWVTTLNQSNISPFCAQSDIDDDINGMFLVV